MNSIASALSYSAGTTHIAALQSIQAASTNSNSSVPQAQTDSVALSAVAQAHAMQQQGMAVNTIAANMGVSTQTVDGYLGLTSGTSGQIGGSGLAELKKLASEVRVNPPADGSQT